MHDLLDKEQDVSFQTSSSQESPRLCKPREKNELTYNTFLNLYTFTSKFQIEDLSQDSQSSKSHIPESLLRYWCHWVIFKQEILSHGLRSPRGPHEETAAVFRFFTHVLRWQHVRKKRPFCGEGANSYCISHVTTCAVSFPLCDTVLELELGLEVEQISSDGV